jgi:hypothetical protein
MMATDGPPFINWQVLRDYEPGLAELERDILALPMDGVFCAPLAWEKVFKPRLGRLIGHRRGAPERSEAERQELRAQMTDGVINLGDLQLGQAYQQRAQVMAERRQRDEEEGLAWLRSMEAYECAARHLWQLMPDCRGDCACSRLAKTLDNLEIDEVKEGLARLGLELVSNEEHVYVLPGVTPENRAEVNRLLALLDLQLSEDAPKKGNGQVGNRLDIVHIDDVQERDVVWLWSGRIPMGMVTILGGDPGDGKSYVTVSLACAVTRGTHLPDDDSQASPPADVLMANYEDTPEEVIKKRARLIGYGPGGLRLINGRLDAEGHRHPFTAADLPLVEAQLRADPNIKVVIIDPVGSYVGGKVNTSADNEVRAAIMPLGALARNYRVAVVVVMHLRKAEAERILYRLSGSAGGFGGVARSVLLAGKEQESGRRAVAHIKCNVGPLREPVEFVIDDTGLTWKGLAPELSAEALMAGSGRDHRLKAAMQWLLEQFGEPRPSGLLRNTIKDRARDTPHKWRTVERAADELGVRKTQEHDDRGRKQPAMWYLDDDD